MTWVNIKKLERKVEAKVMVLISRNPSRGMDLQSVKDHFIHRSGRRITSELDIPGWTRLAPQKRGHKVDKIISRLIKAGRARIEKELGENERLVALNVLDKIVFALEQEDEPDG